MADVRLKFTENMLEQVVYGMENQREHLLLNPKDGSLQEKGENEGSLIPLPHWDPAEGYRLMEQFAGTLPDSAFRVNLIDILHSGTGVFRRFKNALKERPEMENLWRRYKKKEMRRIALSWLSRWSEALALESLGPEPEECEDLTLADFIFRPAEKKDGLILQMWDIAAAKEIYPDMTDDQRRAALKWERGAADPAAGKIIIVENPSKEPVGYAWMHIINKSMQIEGRLHQLYLLPEYRGLGIGRILAEKAFQYAEELGAQRITLRTGSSKSHLDAFLQREGFHPVAVFWCRSKTKP